MRSKKPLADKAKQDSESSTRSPILDELVDRSLSSIAAELSRRVREDNARLNQFSQRMKREKEHMESLLHVSRLLHRHEQVHVDMQC